MNGSKRENKIQQHSLRGGLAAGQHTRRDRVRPLRPDLHERAVRARELARVRRPAVWNSRDAKCAATLDGGAVQSQSGTGK